MVPEICPDLLGCLSPADLHGMRVVESLIEKQVAEKLAWPMSSVPGGWIELIVSRGLELFIQIANCPASPRDMKLMDTRTMQHWPWDVHRFHGQGYLQISNYLYEILREAFRRPASLEVTVARYIHSKNDEESVCGPPKTQFNDMWKVSI